MPGQLYAILHHEGIERPHFDLMFQTSLSSMLATWRAPVWRPQGEMTLERINDHRLSYLTFEGVIPGNRGTVRRVEQGICEVEQAGNVWTIRLRPVPVGEPLTLIVSKSADGVWRCVPQANAVA
jgi:hypothetical protein